MNANPDISVIVPVYNVEPYLKECLDSVVCQQGCTYEIICINDGSTDGSLHILNAYKSQYSNMSVITQQNSGLSATRNRGMGLARGKYIYFIDSDDYLKDSNALCFMINEMESLHLNILCFGAELFWDGKSSRDKDKECFIFRIPQSFGFFENGYDLYVKLSQENAVMSGSPLQCWRRDFLINSNFRYPEGILHEDILFYFITMLSAKNVKHTNKILYRRRVRHGSITDRNDYFESFYGYFYCLHAMQDFWMKQSFPAYVDKVIKKRLSARRKALKVEYARLNHTERMKSSKLLLSQQFFLETFLEAFEKREKTQNEMYIFPYHLFPFDSRVVIYGAGEVGKSFYRQAVSSSYIHIVGIVDTKAEKLREISIPVTAVSDLHNIEYDYILIAVMNKAVADEIRQQLIEMGISEKAIKWENNIYEKNSFFNNFYYPFLLKNLSF